MATRTRCRRPRVSASALLDSVAAHRANAHFLEEEPAHHEAKPEAAKPKIPKEDESLSPFSDEDVVKRK